MRVVVTTEARFDRTPDGACWNVGPSDYDFRRSLAQSLVPPQSNLPVISRWSTVVDTRSELFELAVRSGLKVLASLEGLDLVGPLIDGVHIGGHDSDKSYEGRMWAYALVWAALAPERHLRLGRCRVQCRLSRFLPTRVN